MVTIVTDMMIFSLKTCIFLKKKREKSSKILKIGLKTAKCSCFYPQMSRFEAEIQQEITKMQQKQKKTSKNKRHLQN
jgi:hypothetical protein